MADLKISQFFDGGTVQTGDEIATSRLGINTKVFVGSAAALDVGSGGTDIPQNQDLGSGAFSDTGTGVDDIVTFGDDGVGNIQYPAADGNLITKLKATAMAISNAAFSVLVGTNPQTLFDFIDDYLAALPTEAFLRRIPQNSQSGAYTLVLTDAGKHILHPSADTTARIWTIPANASVAFPISSAVTFVNQNAAGVITIAITTDTMRLAGAGTTGSRTLAANGVATALKITSTEWIISGTGLT